jgi:hypothetical protein
MTGEHKMKRAALQAEFGDRPAVIGRVGERFNPLQSMKSKRLHFGAKLCEPCNSTRTQKADRCFERLTEAAKAAIRSGQSPGVVLTEGYFAKSLDDRVAVGQYLAKLICCHLADVARVRWTTLSDYALNQTREMPCEISLGMDPIFADYKQEIGDHPYAAHGGLVAIWSTSAESVAGFQSSLTFGPLRYVFRFNTGLWDRLSLPWNRIDFWRQCRNATLASEQGQADVGDLIRLGFIESDANEVGAI